MPGSASYNKSTLIFGGARGMRRREFIGLVGGAAAWPLAVKADNSVARIGLLGAGSAEGSAVIMEDLKRGLKDNGMLEGRNYLLDAYWAEGDYGRFPGFARDLVATQSQVILVNTIAAAWAAQRATTVIPIVLMGINDPVGSGLVASLARPGGNITGMATLNQDSASKLVQNLRSLLPDATDVAVILNPGNPSNPAMLNNLRSATRSLGVVLRPFEVSTPGMMDAAFVAILAHKPDAIFVIPDSATVSLSKPIAAIGLEHRIPIFSANSALTTAGGLISYGISQHDIPERSAYFVRKVLDGVKPADLPVEQPTHLVLTINLKTARALGVAIPDTLLAIADEVIE
jgi:putative tryptophan/tyrosine transport system substrate-binding protein